MIDDRDVEILKIIQDNARLPQSDIARAVGLAPSAVLERLRKLEANGVIQGYTALVDPQAVDQRMLAFVAVRTADRAWRVACRAGARPGARSARGAPRRGRRLPPPQDSRARRRAPLADPARASRRHRRRALDPYDHRPRDSEGKPADSAARDRPPRIGGRDDAVLRASRGSHGSRSASSGARRISGSGSRSRRSRLPPWPPSGGRWPGWS